MKNYILQSFVLPTTLVFIFLVAFLMTFQLVQVLSLLNSQDGNIELIAQIIYQIGLTITPTALPISLILGGIYCSNKMSQNSEYIALKSFGYSDFKIYFPIFLISLLSVAWIYLMSQNYIPLAKKNFRSTLHSLRSKSFINKLDSGKFFNQIPDILLFSKKVDKETLSLEDTFIQINKPNLERLITAKTGVLNFTKSKRNDTEDLNITLFDGSIIQSNNLKDSKEKILFKSYKFSINNSESYNISNKASAMTKKELEHFLSLDAQELKARKATPEAQAVAKVDYFNRINTAIVCFIFPFLGFCLGISSNRSKGRSITFITMIILIIYYASYFGLIGYAKKGQISALLSVIIPTFILSSITLYFYRKTKWLS